MDLLKYLMVPHAGGYTSALLSPFASEQHMVSGQEAKSCATLALLRVLDETEASASALNALIPSSAKQTTQAAVLTDGMAHSPLICSFWYHYGSCTKAPNGPSYDGSGKVCKYIHDLTPDMRDPRVQLVPRHCHPRICGLVLCPQNDTVARIAQGLTCRPDSQGEETNPVSAVHSIDSVHVYPDQALPQLGRSSIELELRIDTAQMTKSQKRRSRQRKLASYAKHTPGAVAASLYRARASQEQLGRIDKGNKHEIWKRFGNVACLIFVENLLIVKFDDKCVSSFTNFQISKFSN